MGIPPFLFGFMDDAAAPGTAGRTSHIRILIGQPDGCISKNLRRIALNDKRSTDRVHQKFLISIALVPIVTIIIIRKRCSE